MKNQLIYTTLQYKHSLLKRESFNIGLLFYSVIDGKISFIEGLKDIQNLQNYYPNLKVHIIEDYLRLIKEKIRKHSFIPYLDINTFRSFIGKNILTPDDSALHFGKIAVRSGINGNFQEIVEAYSKLFLPYSFEQQRNKQYIISKYDTLLSQYLSDEKWTLIENNVILKKEDKTIRFDRYWKSDIDHFVKAVSFDTNTEMSLKQIAKKLRIDLHTIENDLLQNRFSIDFWITAPQKPELNLVYQDVIQNIQNVNLPINLVFEEQWEDYMQKQVKI